MVLPEYRLASGATLDELQDQVNGLIAQGYLLINGDARYTIQERNGIWTRELRLPVPSAPAVLPPPLTLSSDTKAFLQGLVLSIEITGSSPPIVISGTVPITGTITALTPGTKDVKIVNTLQAPVITDEKQGNP